MDYDDTIVVVYDGFVDASCDVGLWLMVCVAVIDGGDDVDDYVRW